MERQIELALIDELLDLRDSKSQYLDDHIAFNSIEQYQSEAIFQHEQAQIFKRLPSVAAHTSEMPNPGDFVTRDIAGRSILVTRSADGEVHAFLNICRHRGTQLEGEASGCKHRFTCPYHAWSYANDGALLSGPHIDIGFPDLKKAEYSLKALQCDERLGFIWVIAEPSVVFDFDAYFATIAPEVEGLELESMAIAQQEWTVHGANWKVLVEGGLESYHFKVAHRKTIGPYFEDNLSSYQVLGDHIRSVLMRSSMHTLRETPRDAWRLRDHANIIYTFFPTTQLLVQSDHVVWINSRPISAGKTELRLVTLAPKSRLNEQAYWEKNHRITATTLNEDFAIGESIQKGFASGANAVMTFGRFEGALPEFGRIVNRHTRAE